MTKNQRYLNAIFVSLNFNSEKLSAQASISKVIM